MWQQMRILARLQSSSFPDMMQWVWRWVVHPALHPEDHHQVPVVFREAGERSDDKEARANDLVDKGVCCELVTQVDQRDSTSTNKAMQRSCASITYSGVDK